MQANSDQKMDKPSLLITGPSGFVGSNLIRVFQDKFELFGLDIKRECDLQDGQGKLPGEKVFGWDQLERLPEVEVMIHLAGKAHDTANTSREEEYFDVNLELTKKIFDHFLQSEAKTFIFFSSVKAVADTLPGEALTEEAKPDPQTAYGRSKLAAERYVLEAMERWNEETKERLNDEVLRFAHNDEGDAPNDKEDAQNDKRVYILRPCMIHGPGNKGNLNLLYNVVRKGIPWPLGAFDNLRSFVSIKNVAYVLRRLFESDIPSGIYQLADDEPVSTNALIRLMAASLGRTPRIWTLPQEFIRFLARTGDVLHLPLNSERLKKLTESYVVSNAKIKNALGIDAMPVSAADGLKETLASFITSERLHD